uniref:Uncharacterized protein n=1 Tax=Anguilla anguilla TaxID=7936 RepID=A0A0E9TAH4_ANGAN
MISRLNTYPTHDPIHISSTYSVCHNPSLGRDPQFLGCKPPLI